MLVRIVIGGVLAAAVTWSAHRARALSTSGAIAATAVGIAAVSAGWGWGALLVVYFVSSTLIGRWRHAARASLVHGVTDKGGRRDAVQVLANGGVFAIAAVAWSVRPDITLAAAAAGALAAAAADTWATSLGSRSRTAPRHLLTGISVPPGTSGGVTRFGSTAALAGAAITSAAAALVSHDPALLAAGVIIGVTGMLADSALGGSVQARFRCPTCGTASEWPVHRCGTATILEGGVRWLTNDLVNALATTLAALLGAATWHLVR